MDPRQTNANTFSVITKSVKFQRNRSRLVRWSSHGNLIGTSRLVFCRSFVESLSKFCRNVEVLSKFCRRFVEGLSKGPGPWGPGPWSLVPWPRAPGPLAPGPWGPLRLGCAQTAPTHKTGQKRRHTRQAKNAATKHAKNKDKTEQPLKY